MAACFGLPDSSTAMIVFIMWGGTALAVCNGLSSISILCVSLLSDPMGVTGDAEIAVTVCGPRDRTTAGPPDAVVPSHFPMLWSSPRLHLRNHHCPTLHSHSTAPHCME